MNITLYNGSLGTALVLMLFFAFYFLVGKTPDKRIFGNYIRSRRIMALALLVLAANYSVHLFCGLRFHHLYAAILMNLSTYFLSYWLFTAALVTLLDRFYVTRKRFCRHLVYWLIFTSLSCAVLLLFPDTLLRNLGLAVMALWLLAYGVTLSYRIIKTHRRAVRLFDDTHAENIAAYIQWMSIFMWWAVIYGVSCGLLTFLPSSLVSLWIISSIPFYIYLFCSYMNYLLFYEQVESILEKEIGEQTDVHQAEADSQPAGIPAYHAVIEKNLSAWLNGDGYTKPGLNIEELAVALGTNRTYLSSYIKSVYRMSFREWIGGHRIEYSKRLLLENPKMTIAEVSEASGFLSLSYFIKMFTGKEKMSPSKWRKANFGVLPTV